jgi:hypothetical protein
MNTAIEIVIAPFPKRPLPFSGKPLITTKPNASFKKQKGKGNARPEILPLKSSASK